MSTAWECGRLGEEIAARYLQRRGYDIVARNYMPKIPIKRGEVDIIAERSGVLYCVEVKTTCLRHSSENVDPPQLRITRAKLHAMERVMAYYVRAYQRTGAIRYCAISVCINVHTRKAQVQFLQDIFL